MKKIIKHSYFQLRQIAVWGLHNMRQKAVVPANNHGPVTAQDRLHFYTAFVNKVLKGD